MYEPTRDDKLVRFKTRTQDGQIPEYSSRVLIEYPDSFCCDIGVPPGLFPGISIHHTVNTQPLGFLPLLTSIIYHPIWTYELWYITPGYI